MKKFILFGMILASFLIFTNTANACSCIMAESPSKSLEKAVDVFSGRVLDVKKPRLGASSIDSVKVKFNVLSVWKEAEYKEMEVSTAMSSASCGFGFEKGKEYLVYTYDNKGETSVSLCSRTKLLSEAGEDLQELGSGKAPAIEGEPKSSSIMMLAGAVILVVSILAFFIFRKK